VFLDETGFLLQPTRRRTWAPRGQTPVQHAWDRHDRLSAISALSVSPRRHRLGLHFHLQRRNVHAEDLAPFLCKLHRQLARRIILVWDRSRPHRKAATTLLAKFRWLRVEWLPAYAPDLDPCEECWNHAKYSDLANFIPADLAELQQAVAASLGRQRSKPALLRSFFGYAGLGL
jgi:transposase